MLKEKKVNVKISPANYNKYYDKYGYYNCGDIIEIDIEDLTKKSTIIITAICEECSIENNIKYYNYTKQTDKSRYLCIKCSRIKIKETNLEKYGCVSPLQNKNIMIKTKKTLIENYGVDNISKLESVRDDRRNNFKSEDFKNKSKETCLKKYGVDNPSKSEIVKNKKMETTFRNYGVNNPSQSIKIFESAQISGKKIIKHVCGLMYRGTYEKDFLDFCIKENIVVEKGITIEYDFNGVLKYYHSDFYLPKINMICEIKSSYYYELYKDKNISKKYGTIKKGYNFIFIIDKKYDEIKKFLLF